MKQLSAGLRLTLVLLGVLASTVVLDALFRGARIDLTERQLYSVSPATADLVEAVDRPVELTFYFSDEASEGLPGIRNHAAFVRQLLRALVLRNPEHLELNEVDPVPFSEAEDAAALAGLQAVPVNVAGDSLYMGLVVRGPDGRETVLPFLQPDRDTFLEYEVAEALQAVTRERVPVVGIHSELPWQGEFDFRTGRPAPGWLALTQLRESFDVREVDPEAGPIEDVDVLVLVHPKSLSELGQYHVEQFLLGGGRGLFFVDADAQRDAMGGAPGMPTMPAESRRSYPRELFEHWGLSLPVDEVFADRELAMPVTMPGTERPMRHLAIVGLGPEQMADGFVPLEGIDSLVLSHAGHLVPDPDAPLEFTPLLTGSDDSGTLPPSPPGAGATARTLNAEFAPAPEPPLVLAVLVEGSIRSAWPDGPPAEPEPEGDGSGSDAAAPGAPDAPAADPDPASGSGGSTPESGEAGNAPAHLPEGAATAVVVSDTDLLANASWVQLQSFFGRDVAVPFAGNGTFVANLVDYLSGSPELIRIRSRATYARPFDRVQALRREAEERFLAQEQALRAELTTLENRLAELEEQRDLEDGPGLTEEQAAELERFQEQRVEIRRRLRAVQRELTEDIERLGNRLAFVNVVVAPLLLTGALLLLMRLRLGRWPF